MRFEAAQDNLKRCQAAACAGKMRLFYLDESGFANTPNVQRSWAPKNKPHAADASVLRHRLNMVGALDYTSGNIWHDLHEATVNRNAVVALIARIARCEQRSPLPIVVLDNARIHHAIDQKKLDERVINHHVVLMYLPPCRPEIKPIEIVWKQAK